MGILKKFFKGARKPQGVMGRMMAKRMNGGHARLSAWGLYPFEGRGKRDDL